MSALPIVLAAGLLLAVLTVGMIARSRATGQGAGGRLSSRVALLATAGLGLVSAAAWLIGGLLVLLALVLTPRTPADAGVVLVLKVLDVAGWFATGAWLLRDWSRMRLRVLAPATIAWIWVVALAFAIAGRAYLSMGY